MAVIVVRDVVTPSGVMIQSQGVFISQTDLASYQAAGYRLLMATPTRPIPDVDLPTFEKSPSDSAPWTFDWSAWLPSVNGETITSSLWLTSSPDLTIIAQSATDTTTYVTVGGGTLGEMYVVTNRIETATRQEDQSFRVQVLQH